MLLSFGLFIFGIVVLIGWFHLYRLYFPGGGWSVVVVSVPGTVSAARGAMKRFVPGISTGLYYDRNIFETLPAIAESGFKFVEIWASPREHHIYQHFDWHKKGQVNALAACLKALDIRVSSMHAPFSDALDLSSFDEERRRAAVEETVRSMEVLKYLEGECLVVHPASNGRCMHDRDRGFRQSRSSIEELLEKARSLGVKLAVENQLPHILGSDAATLLKLIEDLPAETVGVCFDTSHANLMPGRSVEDLFSEISPRLMALHVSDNYGERDDHFMLGDGKINWRNFTDALRRSSYSGIFMLEVSGASMQRGQHNGLDAAYTRAQQLLH